MNRNKQKPALATELLCNILSAYATKSRVEACLEQLLADGELLDLCIQLANKRHLVAALYHVLKSHALDNRLNTDLHGYMCEIVAFMQQRAADLTALAEEIIHISNQHGITPLLSKGSATLFSNVYPAQGMRFMSDLDILYQEKDVLTIFQLLQAQGFSIPAKYLAESKVYANIGHLLQTDIRDVPHDVPLYREGAPCMVELHVRPLKYIHRQYLDTRIAFATAIPIEFPAGQTLSAKRLSPENEIIYCFAHSQVAHGYHQRYYLDILQMDFFVRLVRQYADELDWQNIHLRVKQAGGAVSLQHYLYAVNRLFATDFPLPDAGVDEQQLQKHYLSSLVSCVPQPDLRWRARLFMVEVTSPLSRERMQALYKTDSSLGVYQARLRHIAIKLWKFRHPGKLLQRIRYAFRMF